MQLLFRKNIDRYCAYCQFAGRIDEAHMICQHCGVVPCELIADGTASSSRARSYVFFRSAPCPM